MRRFLLIKQGLVAPMRLSGMAGLLAFVEQAGCVQYDPLDVCGKSHELTLFSRVAGLDKGLIHRALYRDRTLIDYWDKNMAILSVTDWPMLHDMRQRYLSDVRSLQEVVALKEHVLQHIAAEGPVTSKTLPVSGSGDWYWGRSSLARVALETLYFQGHLCIWDKNNTVKSYDLAERCIPRHLLDAPDPFVSADERHDWQLFRRINAVGALWNRASEAFLGMADFKSAERLAAFDRLLRQGKLMPVQIEGLKDTLYVNAADACLFEAAASPLAPCVRFIAPLDSFIWDRKLTRALFDFDYTWEVYTPPHKRQYGYYVLPVLYGDALVGRVELRAERKEKALVLKALWFEKDFVPDGDFKRLFEAETARLADFLGLATLRSEVQGLL